MTYQESVTLLKNIVKNSHLDNQKHIDLTMCQADQRPKYQLALLVAQTEIKKGNVTETEFKKELGLI